MNRNGAGVYFCEDTEHKPGLVLAEGVDLHRAASVIPDDNLVMVALSLDDGEQPLNDFETATGVFYQLSEVEEIGEGQRLAWYFQQETPSNGQ